MKKKLFSVVMAVVMTVVCLAGCSGDFSKDSFINAAKKNGLKELEDTQELTRIKAEPGETKAFYYDVENLQIVQYLKSSFDENLSVEDVKGCVIVNESIGENADHGTSLTRIYYLILKDNKTAENLYKEEIKSFKLMKPEEGKKNGVTYTIGYLGPDDSRHDNSTVELACGVYLKDNQLVWIRSDYYSTMKNDCVEGICKSLGLVSPYKLKKS